MQTSILVFPGSNCDRDMAVAIERFTGQRPQMLWHKETHIPDTTDLIVLPGGFSYGDYLRSGAMAAHSPIIQDLKRHAARGTRILGVCNGFQVLTETHLLPGALMRNQGLTFICKAVHLKPENTNTAFAQKYAGTAAIQIPVAHHDGNYTLTDAALAEVEASGQVAFRYCDADGAVTAASNINGSVANIAGVYNKDKTILGMMPHPERAVDPALQDGTHGAYLFESLIEALA